MMKGFSLIVLLLVTTTIGDATRILGFKPFYLKSDSHVKPDPASSYASLGERPPEMAVLAHKELLSRRESVKKLSVSETKLKRNVSANFKDLNVLPRELQQQIRASVKFYTVEPQMKKSVAYVQPLGHSPGVGHDYPPGLKH